MLMVVKVNSMFRVYVLLLLAEGPKHGYDLMRIVGEKIGEKPSAGQLYPFLSELNSSGLVEVVETGERERKKYSFTSEGRKFFKSILKRFDSLLVAAISKDLVSCAHCGCKVYSGGFEEKINGKIVKFCCSYCAKSFKAR